MLELINNIIYLQRKPKYKLILYLYIYSIKWYTGFVAMLQSSKRT